MEDTTTAVRRGRLGDAWATRPPRPREGRMIAGVSSGIAARYDIDPVLVRVGFAVAAVCGPGIPMYLVGCALLPDGGPTVRSRLSIALTAVLMLAAAVVVAVLLFTTDGSWLLAVVAAAALLVALHVSRGGRVVPVRPPRPARRSDGDTATAADPVDGSRDGATTTPVAAPGPIDTDDRVADVPTVVAAAMPPPGTDTPEVDRTEATAHGGILPPYTGAVGADPAPPRPPGWDPLGAAPFAWDLPEPTPVSAPEPEPTSRLTPVTLAFAVLVAGAAAVVGLLVPASGLSLAAVPAAGLAVVGLGLVIGAFRHRGRWLIPFAVLLAAGTWLASAVPWADIQGGVGSVAAAPRTAADVDPLYRRGVGDVTLNLAGLDLRTPPGTAAPPIRTSARVGLGSISVTVPRDADLTVRGEVGLGDLTLDRREGGGSSNAVTVVDPGPDGPGGRAIDLEVYAGLGSVTVNRV